MKDLLLSALLIILAGSAFGQDIGLARDVKEPRHTVHFNAGTLGRYSATNLNYETYLGSPGAVFEHVYLRAGAGLWTGWDATGFYGLTGLTGLTGKRNGHVEVHLGVAPVFKIEEEPVYVLAIYTEYPEPNKDVDYLGLYPSVSLGYRYQEPGGHFIFRTGVSWPDGIYLGVGLRF